MGLNSCSHLSTLTGAAHRGEKGWRTSEPLEGADRGSCPLTRNFYFLVSAMDFFIIIIFPKEEISRTGAAI